MRVTRLAVDAFRNLREVDLSPAPGVNVVCGQNGQGKTNLLEALWMFTGSKSFRGAKEAEMVPLQSAWARATLSYFGEGRDNEASFVMGERRAARQNGVGLESLGEMAGRFYAVVFSPVQLMLVKGAPVERRRALDTVICQLKPRYLSLLSQYNRLLTQRNSLLKDARLASQLLDTLDVWDAALARCGALVAKTRKSYVERLLPFSRDIYHGIAQGREQLTFSYRMAEGADEEAGLLALLAAARGDDLRTGSTSAGPHRDDLDIEISGMSARLYASQGQQRSAVLALKLGECALIETLAGESPVVLLDDVMSELDDLRRDYLLHRLENRQIFITCCDAGQISEVDALFCMEGGRLLPSPQGGT